MIAVEGRGRGQCWPTVGWWLTRGVDDGRVGGRYGKHCQNRRERKKTTKPKIRNEGFKRSRRRDGIPCDVGVPCSMIGAQLPRCPDGMAGLVLQKRHRPGEGRSGPPEAGREGSRPPKTPANPLPISPGSSPDLPTCCIPSSFFASSQQPIGIGHARSST